MTEQRSTFCMVPARNCPFAVPPLRRAGSFRRSLTLALFIGYWIGTMIITVGYTMYTTIQPPVVVQNSTILNPVVEQDGELRFAIRSMMAVDLACVGSVTREFYQWTEVNGELMRAKKRNSGPAPIVLKGETGYVVDVPLPPHMRPGQWEFQGETTYDCGYIWAFVKEFPRGLLNGGVLRFRTKAMPFMVVAKNTMDQK